MDDEMHLGLCIIKVLCLLVIAMSLHKMANPYSYMAEPMNPRDAIMADSRSNFLGDGQTQPPVFWNIGSVEDTDLLLQQAAGQVEPVQAPLAAPAAVSGFYGGESHLSNCVAGYDAYGKPCQ